jgi:hypothetical protein
MPCNVGGRHCARIDQDVFARSIFGSHQHQPRGVIGKAKPLVSSELAGFQVVDDSPQVVDRISEMGSALALSHVGVLGDQFDEHSLQVDDAVRRPVSEESVHLENPERSVDPCAVCRQRYSSIGRIVTVCGTSSQ